MLQNKDLSSSNHQYSLFPCSVILEAQGDMTETLWAHSLCKYQSLPKLTSPLQEAELVGLLPTTPEPTALAQDQRRTKRHHVSSTHLPFVMKLSLPCF